MAKMYTYTYDGEPCIERYTRLDLLKRIKKQCQQGSAKFEKYRVYRLIPVNRDMIKAAVVEYLQNPASASQYLPAKRYVIQSSVSNTLLKASHVFAKALIVELGSRVTNPHSSTTIDTLPDVFELREVPLIKVSSNPLLSGGAPIGEVPV